MGVLIIFVGTLSSAKKTTQGKTRNICGCCSVQEWVLFEQKKMKMVLLLQGISNMLIGPPRIPRDAKKGLIGSLGITRAPRDH